MESVSTGEHLECRLAGRSQTVDVVDFDYAEFVICDLERRGT
jgi:hypothetical protein